MNALPEWDFRGKRLLENLPSGQDIFYRVTFVDLNDANGVSEPVVGHFRTAPAGRRNVRLVWSGDTAGQGWGIDEARGGMTTYATMLRHEPDFFLHSGDTIYADGPITAEKEMPNKEIWRSVVAEGVEKVAETLDEYRGRWKYNMLDRHVRAMNAAVPTLFQWDDHEVVNNWSASKDLTARRPLHGESRCRCWPPAPPRLPRDDADPLPARRAGPRLPQDRLRPVARRVHGGPALLSRRQRRQCRADAVARGSASSAPSRSAGSNSRCWIRAPPGRSSPPTCPSA
jgi:hypothetical protein